MAYKKTPSYLWQKDTGLWHFKLGIPEALRKHYPSGQPGRFKTHIVESLHTHNRAEAMRLKEPLLVKYREEFRRLSGGVVTQTINPARLRVADLREAMVTHREISDADDSDDAWDAHSAAALYLDEQIEQVCTQIEREEGAGAAQFAYRRMREPESKTLNDALGLFESTAELKAQSIGAYRLAVRELLGFLKVADCYPDEVPMPKVIAYVDMLNAGPLSKSVKDKRLSNLNQLWKQMRRRGWPPSPWEGHKVTQPAKVKAHEPGAGAGGDDDNEDVRPFTDKEAIRLFTLKAPEDKRRRTYTRELFRELYALGFVTGMRLNELVSLRPMDVTVLDEHWRLLSVPKEVAKKAGSIRKIPVCHPVAVAILDARLARQEDPRSRLFSECVVGGPDSKPSWHVSKAMSRERLDARRLGFSSEVNFHSTRRSFATLMENSHVVDTIGQQRYIGHAIPTQLHGVYSGGTGIEKLKRIVDGLVYPPAVEEAIRLAEPKLEPHRL